MQFTRFQKQCFLAAVTLLMAACNTQSANNNKIRIGLAVPLSGNGATIGTYSKEGVQMAIDEVNAAGGLLGKQIELDIQDSKSDPKEGLSIIKNMLSAGQKPFMVYSIISGVTMAIKPETEKK